MKCVARVFMPPRNKYQGLFNNLQVQHASIVDVKQPRSAFAGNQFCLQSSSCLLLLHLFQSEMDLSGLQPEAEKGWNRCKEYDSVFSRTLCVRLSSNRARVSIPAKCRLDSGHLGGLKPLPICLRSLCSCVMAAEPPRCLLSLMLSGKRLSLAVAVSP